jgi:hypothetical protein
MLAAPRISAALLFALAASSASIPVQAQQAASEIRLSQNGDSPSIATDGRGGFVVVWTDRGTPFTNILARVLPKGARQPRAPIVVNDAATQSQVAPDVAVDAAGRFAVVWQDGLEFSGDAGGDARVAGRSFSAVGQGKSPEVLLSPSAVERQIGPQVASQDNGDYVAAWTEDLLPHQAIKAVRFSADGSPLGPEMKMKAAGEINIAARVASFPGGFAVGWSEYFECSGGRSPAFVSAIARFDATGQSAGRIYRVGSSKCEAPPGPGALLALVGSRAGALAAFAGTQYTLQRFGPSGEPVGGLLQLPPRVCDESDCTFVQVLAMDNAGRFAVVWERIENGGASLAAQLFNARGKPLTALVSIGDDTSQSSEPAAALADDGTLAVVWRRDSGNSQQRGLYLSRLRLP